MPKGQSVAEVGAFAIDDNWEQVGGSGERVGRGSPIDEILEQIRANGQYHGSDIGIARYNNANTAKGAVNSLRTRLGPKEASGFVFNVRFNKGANQYGIVAKYDPAAVTDEGKQAHLAATEKRKADEKAARVKRQQEKNAKANQTVEDAAEGQKEAAEARVNTPVGGEVAA